MIGTEESHRQAAARLMQFDEGQSGCTQTEIANVRHRMICVLLDGRHRRLRPRPQRETNENGKRSTRLKPPEKLCWLNFIARHRILKAPRLISHDCGTLPLFAVIATNPKMLPRPDDNEESNL